jgi:hypothetical protein
VSEAYRTGSGLLLLAPTALSFWRFAMSEVQVRPFRRADREQLTALVNAHIQAVVPGVSVSVNTVLSQLERDPGEFIVDPWVAERATLVAEQRRRVVAAAHLLRYGEGEDVGQAYRGTAEINWLLFWPEANHWPVTSMHIDYGQKAARHEHLVVVFPTDLWTTYATGSTLTDPDKQPHTGRYGEDGAELHHDLVNARNFALTAFTTVLGDARDFHTICLGPTLPRPRCTPTTTSGSCGCCRP